VAEDPRLPARTIQVAGRSRQVHVREYGDPSLPPLVVLPGSASDIRAYLPLRALSDSHRMIFWDLRGNGLSERVNAEELSFDAMVEEIDQIQQAINPGGPISLLAHSWSAAFVALYLARHPERVHHAILLEPPGLKASFQQEAGLALNLLAPGYLDLVWTTGMLSPTDQATLDYEVLGMLHSGVRDLFCDADHPPAWPVWRPGGLALAVWESPFSMAPPSRTTSPQASRTSRARCSSWARSAARSARSSSVAPTSPSCPGRTSSTWPARATGC
jgi:proline iminopeptidase